MDKCKVIALVNQKGGVAKTTSTLNLGVGLANQGSRVLLIDADPQGSLTISLGIKNPDDLQVSLATVMDAVIDDELGDEVIGILHHDEGVDLMPSNIELSGMETGLFNIMSREYVLKNYIDKIRQNYDYILIDCMPSLGMMTINALVASDSVIIPSQPSFLSTKGLNLLLHSISKVKRSINPKLTIDGILLTMVDNRTLNAKDIISSLRSGVGQNIKVFDTEIPHSVRAAECSLTGKSIFSHDKNGKVAAAYEKFDTLRKVESFRAWIFAILVNQCKSQWKKRYSQETVELKDEPSYHPCLEDQILTEDILSCLSGEERRIVVLAVFGGYKGEEIAKILGYKHSTIRSKYRRALRKLEQKLLSEEVQR